MSLANVCDVPVRNAPCGKYPATPIELTIGGKAHSAGDICDGHSEVLARAAAMLGLSPATSAPAKKTAAKTTSTKKATSKRKTAPKKKPGGQPGANIQPQLRTASGAKYTSAEARAWLVERGEIPSDSTGRIAQDKLKLYADAH